MYNRVPAGERDSLITIQHLPEGADDGQGNTYGEWTALHSNIPARVRMLSAREQFAAAQAQSDVTHEIVCDPFTDVTPAMRALIGSTIYNFVSAQLMPNDSRPVDLRIEAKRAYA